MVHNRDRAEPHDSAPPTNTGHTDHVARRFISTLYSSCCQFRQPKIPEISVWQCVGESRAATQSPKSMSRLCRIPSQKSINSQLSEHPVAFASPLLQDITPQSSSNPFVQISQRTQYFCYVKIRFPTKQGFS